MIVQIFIQIAWFINQQFHCRRSLPMATKMRRAQVSQIFYAALGTILIWSILVSTGCQSTLTPTVTTLATEMEPTTTNTVEPATPTLITNPTRGAVATPTQSLTLSESTGEATTDTPVPSPEPSLTPRVTATSIYPIYSGPPLSRFETGIQLHLHREDLDQLFGYLRTLGIGWVKNQISWKLYQPEADRFDDFRWQELDGLVTAAEREGLKVMLSVAKAPEWSRATTELDGPPADYSTFQAFMTYIASRYRGRVHAYELWNEPNLQREWNGMPLNANSFVALIQAGVNGVRQVDSEVVLISGAPATTGINDGISAIDDRLFLQNMVAAGVTDYVDAIGAHPYGWANPPDSTVTNPDPSIPSHNNHPSFFFLDTLHDYRQILEQAGHSEVPIWVTEFGWGSYDGLGVPPPDDLSYMGYVNEQQQAEYTLRAYELAHQYDWLGPMILWNLNFGPTLGPDFPVSAYSLIRPDGTPRPVMQALAAIQWIDEDPIQPAGD